MPGVSASIEPNRLYNSRTRHENPRYRVAVRRLDFLLDTLLDFTRHRRRRAPHFGRPEAESLCARVAEVHEEWLDGFAAIVHVL